jgi:high-affinity iron transporter
MDPQPSNFHDEARMKQRSIYGLYNTITLGVGGTPMRGFGELSEADRWALAFLAGSMRTTPEQVRKGEALWKQGAGKQELGNFRALVTQQPGEVAAQSADVDAVRSYLVAQPHAISAAAPAPLEVTRAKLAESLAAYRAGDRAGARQHAITAYLEGFELVEAGLDNVDAPLRRQVEEAMMALRSDIDAGKPVEAVANRIAGLQELLDTTQERLGAGEMSATAAFTSALLILLREGLEAILVLAAIIAFVRKTGRSDAMPYIHAGWIAAVLLGVPTTCSRSRAPAAKSPRASPRCWRPPCCCTWGCGCTGAPARRRGRHSSVTRSPPPWASARCGRWPASPSSPSTASSSR